MNYSGPDEQQVQRAKALTEDLLVVVQEEHAKVKTLLQQQQMELHQAQVQYAAYSAYGVCMLRSYSSLLRASLIWHTSCLRLILVCIANWCMSSHVCI